jgi:hypothetical protein
MEQKKEEIPLCKSHRFKIFMCGSNKDQTMSCSRYPAGIVWLVFLISIAVLVSGCMTGDGERDSAVSSLTTPTGEETGAHDTNTSELTKSLLGFVKRPVNSLDKSITRSATIPGIRTTNTLSYTGPGFNATGNDVNISTVLMQTETIPPV